MGKTKVSNKTQKNTRKTDTKEPLSNSEDEDLPPVFTSVLEKKPSSSPEYKPLTDSDEELPLAFTPVKAKTEFKKEDLLFAKYRTSPYWPGVFYKYLHKKKNRKHKAYVYFFDDPNDLSVNVNSYKRILPVAVDKLKRFNCSEKDELIQVGSSTPGFLHGIDQAEYYMRKRALGKMKTFFEYTVEEENLSEDEDKDQSSSSMKENISGNVVPCSSHYESDNSDDTPTKKSCKKLFTNPAPEHSSCKTDEMKGLVSWMKTHSRVLLTDITNGKIESRRHHTFHKGKQTARDKLRWDSGFGDLDEETGQEIFNLLVTWFRDDFHRSQYSAIQYVSDVWLPEAYIHGLMHINKLGYEEAEQKYLR